MPIFNRKKQEIPQTQAQGEFDAATLRINHRDLAAMVTLYNESTLQGHGRVVLLAGNAYSGRTLTLYAIGERLRQERPHPELYVGRFAAGHYEGLEVAYEKQGAFVGEALALTAKFVAQVTTGASEIVDFVGQSLQTWAAGQEALTTAAHNRYTPDELKALIRRAKPAQPLLLLIDDLHLARDQWLLDLLRGLAPEIDQLPVLVVATLEGPAELGEYHEAEPRVLTLARALLARGVAHWASIRPLSRTETEAWLGPAQVGLAAHLHGIADGNPLRIWNLLNLWEQDGHVARSDKDYSWYWTSNYRPPRTARKDWLLARLKRLLEGDPYEPEEVFRLLAYAALEGRRFTAAAVAQAAGWETDEAINLFDDLLMWDTDNPDGLLAESKPAELLGEAGKETLWRYSFVDGFQHDALREIGLTEVERQNALIELVEALQQVYAPEIRVAASTLAVLYRQLNMIEAANQFQKLADYQAPRERLREEALLLLRLDKKSWNHWELIGAVDLLMEAGESMDGYFPYEELVELYQQAAQIALEVDRPNRQAEAEFYLGRALQQLGEYPEARQQILSALVISRKVGNRDGESVCLSGLADIDQRTGSYDDARAQYRQALAINREIGDRAIESTCLYGLAVIDQRTGNYDDARAQYRQALAINREIGRQVGESACLCGLAAVDQHTGNYAAAREQYRQALAIDREIGNRAGESVCLYGLAAVDQLTSNYDAAREQYSQALAINNEIGRRVGESTCLFGLAEVERHTGNYDAAQANYEAALAIERQLGRIREIEIIERRLAELAQAQCNQHTDDSEAARDRAE
jgi:tetratricopeptide (TPR) repeat protein